MNECREEGRNDGGKEGRKKEGKNEGRKQTSAIFLFLKYFVFFHNKVIFQTEAYKCLMYS